MALSQSDKSQVVALVTALKENPPIDIVNSVFGREGNVVAQVGDYSVAQVTGASPLDSPNFFGLPTAPTALVDDNSTQIATTAFVQNQLNNQTLVSGNIFVGNASNVATPVAVSGDATIANTGVLTIANSAVTTAKIADNAVTETKIAGSAISLSGGLLGGAGTSISIKPDITTGDTICPVNVSTNGTGVKLDNVSIKQNIAGIINVADVDGNNVQKIFLKSTTTPSPTSILSREQQIYLGGLNGEVYKFIGNASNQPVLINTPPFKFTLNKTYTPSVTVANGNSYNLFTTVTSTDIENSIKTNMDYINTKFSFQDTNLAIVFPPFKDYTDYKIRLQLQGTIGGASGANRQFAIELRRGNDSTLVYADYVIKIEGNDLTGLARLYTSFVNGLADPFITGGLKIILNNTSGVSITLTGFTLLIQGICTNFIQ